jgi:hypothetical protein
VAIRVKFVLRVWLAGVNFCISGSSDVKAPFDLHRAERQVFAIVFHVNTLDRIEGGTVKNYKLITKFCIFPSRCFTIFKQAFPEKGL